jgi:bifunctional non-homologous end joining protein LigD
MRRQALRFVPPMQATLVTVLPDGDGWRYEVKFDGYRVIALKDGDRVQLRSRNDKDMTAAYPDVVRAMARLAPSSAIVDGEVVAVDERGRPSFQALQHRAAHPRHHIRCYVFDLLHVDGEDLLRQPLDERRARLATVIEGSGLRLSPSLPGSAADITAAVGGLGLEGIVAKRGDSRYEPGMRSDAWRKFKLERQQEFVVGGFRANGRTVDALVVGVYAGRELRFAAKVRAGLTPRLRAMLFDRLQPLASPRCPFADLPSGHAVRWGGGITSEQMAEMTWTRPRLVVQVRFVEWTAEGHLRHSAFVGIREDKAPAAVVRE